MLKHPWTKYAPTPAVPLADRQWPLRRIETPPIWCSVDLRDGNQALSEPMDTARKCRMFATLVNIGFKEIEVGFPSASQTDFDFCRKLVDDRLVPADVTVQVLVQARDVLIQRTFEALRGFRRVIVHLYNSTSTLQRRVVFAMDRGGVKNIAVAGARAIAECAAQYPDTEWVFQYSPESFTETELDYAVEVCDAVLDVWRPTPQKKVILNLPATVEKSTPNIYADQIEWCGRALSRRDSVVLSVHPHNDRGTAVAAAELALLAGADRIEGTLFGNGERTGNVDLVTLALNMYSQGVDPGLDFGNIGQAVESAEFCTRLPTHPRHPYAGELVFTAFSGSHQDAIKKGLSAQAGDRWAVPYLPIDPADIGRSYEPIIRVNSQSGKAGVSFLLERDYGIKLPRKLQVDCGRLVQGITDETGTEMTSHEIWRAFEAEYMHEHPLAVRSHSEDSTDSAVQLTAVVSDVHGDRVLCGAGAGPIDAFIDAMKAGLAIDVQILDYQEHAIGSGADASAVCFVEIQIRGAEPQFGVGIHRNIVTASLKAITSAVNRRLRRGTVAPPRDVASRV